MSAASSDQTAVWLFRHFVYFVVLPELLNAVFWPYARLKNFTIHVLARSLASSYY